MSKNPSREYNTPQDEAMALHGGYVDDGCFGPWVFMYRGVTHVAHAFNEWQALAQIAAQLGMCADDINEAEWEVLARPVSVWESDLANT